MLLKTFNESEKMEAIYYDVASKIAYYERVDGTIIKKIKYNPGFKELFDFELSPGRQTIKRFWLLEYDRLIKRYGSYEDFFLEAIYLMGYDPQRYTTKTGRILVTEVKGFLEDYYNKKRSR